MSGAWVARMFGAAAILLLVMGRLESCALFCIAAGVWRIACKGEADG